MSINEKLDQIEAALTSGLSYVVYCNQEDMKFAGPMDIFKTEQALTTLSELRDELGWKPIETAPKDGTPVLFVKGGKDD